MTIQSAVLKIREDDVFLGLLTLEEEYLGHQVLGAEPTEIMVAATYWMSVTHRETGESERTAIQAHSDDEARAEFNKRFDYLTGMHRRAAEPIIPATDYAGLPNYGRF